MKNGFLAGKMILFFFGLFMIGGALIFVGITNKNRFLMEFGNTITLLGIVVGLLVLVIGFIRLEVKKLVEEWLMAETDVGQPVAIEFLGLSRARLPNDIYFKESIYTGVFESQEIIPMIAELSAYEQGWRAVPWSLLRRQYDRSIGSALTFNDRRVPDLSKEEMSVDYEGRFELEEGKPSLRESNNPPEFLFNGMKHAFESGFVQIFHGEQDDYVVLTDKGIALFPVRQIYDGGEKVTISEAVGSWPRE